MLLERKNKVGQKFHSDICQNHFDTYKISDFKELQSIVVNVISLHVMTPDKFSCISYKIMKVKKEFLINVGISDTCQWGKCGPLQCQMLTMCVILHGTQKTKTSYKDTYDSGPVKNGHNMFSRDGKMEAGIPKKALKGSAFASLTSVENSDICQKLFFLIW